MADWQIRVTVDSTGGRVRVPAGATYAKPGTFATGGSAEFRLALRDANRHHALSMQADVVENVQRGIMRRQVSSGRLVAATADHRNVDWTDFGYSVGDENFLDQSIAKYWRQIEEGYRGHVGRVLFGFWGANIGRINGDRVYAAPPWHRHGRRRSDMFIAATGFRQGGKFARYGADAEEEGRRGAPNFAKATTIKNPIEPHWDYRNAFRAYRPGQRSMQDVTRLLAMSSEAAWRRSMANQGRFWTR